MLGCNFTVCADCEGFMWSFGENKYGQLGTGNKTNFNVPQKILEIPPVHSVSCGNEHTLIITSDSNLWSCGRNDRGQLCHGDQVYRSKPKKHHSQTFQKYQVVIFIHCFKTAKEKYFHVVLIHLDNVGHFINPQITPSLILNLPSNIVQFVCGGNLSLFLDSEGNVYSVGANYFGELRLGHNTDQNVLNKIGNIPPIRTISCARSSSYLIDFEGNLWTFGYNEYGQLGHGDTTNINAPKIVNKLKDIQQIAYGGNGLHFMAKNSQNQIFVTGDNAFGQLGTGDTQSVLIFKELNSQYSTI